MTLKKIISGIEISKKNLILKLFSVRCFKINFRKNYIDCRLFRWLNPERDNMSNACVDETDAERQRAHVLREMSKRNSFFDRYHVESLF